jgi:hypothetical protein
MDERGEYDLILFASVQLASSSVDILCIMHKFYTRFKYKGSCSVVQLTKLPVLKTNYYAHCTN